MFSNLPLMAPTCTIHHSAGPACIWPNALVGLKGPGPVPPPTFPRPPPGHLLSPRFTYPSDLLVRFAERFLPIDRAVADRWGRLTADAASATSPLPVIGGLLAATAFDQNLTLVPRNTKDIAATGVSFFDPWSS